MSKILITAALPYSNNLPHLGTLIGCVLSADVFARYNRLAKRECIYICGTDEYGTATEIKAMEEGVSPKELCDKYYKLHKEIYEWFDISFDIFGRTSDPIHTKLVQEIFLDLYKNGFIFEKEIKQPYDKKVGMFLADRFIVGTCPYCGSTQARADQCDSCGRLLDYNQLIDPKSKLSGEKIELRDSKHLFLDLKKLQKEIEKFVEDREKNGLWTKNTISIAKSWLKEGLEARAITRDLKWGVPVPLKGWENKVFYVWFDAPIGYISISATLTKDYMKWWGGDREVKHYEFIGKDNIPFHAIIFPGMLIGTKRKWTMPYFISATEFLNFEGEKFSKSRQVGVFGDDAKNSQIDSDIWRYYLLANRPEHSDSNFTWEDFYKRTNNELLANLGNLVNRTITFIYSKFDSTILDYKLEQDDLLFLEEQKIIAYAVGSELEKVNIKTALEKVMEYCSNANKYFQKNAPWEEIKNNKLKAQTTMFVLANIIYDLAIISEPFLPKTSKRILDQLNIKEDIKWSDIGSIKLKVGHKINKPKHLFQKLDEHMIQTLKLKHTGKKGLIQNLDLKVGKIVQIDNHPNAENLYVEKIKLNNNIKNIFLLLILNLLILNIYLFLFKT
jgi:methionyl-tRNA synthetase